MFLAAKLRLALIVIPLRFALRLYSLKNPHFQVGYREIANRFLERKSGALFWGGCYGKRKRSGGNSDPIDCPKSLHLRAIARKCKDFFLFLQNCWVNSAFRNTIPLRGFSGFFITLFCFGARRALCLLLSFYGNHFCRARFQFLF